MEKLIKQLESKGLLNEEMLSKLKKCSNAEALMALAKEIDVECTEEEVKELYDYYCSPRELDDDELDQVAGGKGNEDPLARNKKYIVKSMTDQTHDTFLCTCGQSGGRAKGWHAVGGWDNAAQMDQHQCIGCGTIYDHYHTENTWWA